ncbi:MAG: sugar ABC transporter substrate-binding protein [Firmicutes bacterium]|nr:sugar ABC transporter substrate-binding protein [Bacillota bacterium]MCL5039300.1 sugar ABC transporter substrate-binding protein [Bacillota bacterium]
MKLRRLWTSLVVLLLVVTMVGCSGAPKPSAAPADQKSGEQKSATDAAKPITGKLVLYIKTGPEANGMREVAQAYTQKTGIKVEIMEQGAANYFPTLITQLASGTDAFDLVGTNTAFAGPMAAAGNLVALDDYMKKSATGNFDDIQLKYPYQGKTYVIPFDVSAHLLFYRSDLIQNPPQTWDEYLELAKRFTKSVNPNSPTQYGAAWTARSGPEQPKAFYDTMWSYGGFIVNDKNEVGLDADGAIKAAEWWANMAKAKVVPPDMPNWSYGNVLDAMKTGVIAMAGPMWSPAYKDILNSDSPLKDKWKVTLIPGVKQSDGSILRTPFQHSWALGINKASKNIEAAWKFLEFATGPEGIKVYTAKWGTSVRKAVLNDPNSKPRDYYDLILATLKLSKAEPLVPYYLQMHDAMNEALSGILTGTKQPKQAMQEAAAKVRDLIKSSK